MVDIMVEPQQLWRPLSERNELPRTFHLVGSQDPSRYPYDLVYTYNKATPASYPMVTERQFPYVVVVPLPAYHAYDCAFFRKYMSRSRIALRELWAQYPLNVTPLGFIRNNSAMSMNDIVLWNATMNEHDEHEGVQHNNTPLNMTFVPPFQQSSSNGEDTAVGEDSDQEDADVETEDDEHDADEQSDLSYSGSMWLASTPRLQDLLMIIRLDLAMMQCRNEQAARWTFSRIFIAKARVARMESDSREEVDGAR